MKFEKTPIALAAFALCAAAPFAAQAAPSVSFSSPQAGATLAANTSNMCTVGGSNISRVVFTFTNSSGRTWSLNTDSSAPFNCWITSNHYLDGNYTIRAVAYDSAGASASATRNVVINNSGTTTGGSTGGSTGGTTGLTAQFTAPAEGGILQGDATGAVQGPPNCTLTGSNIARVQFFMDGVLTNTDANASNGWGCWLNTKSYTNGTHELKAVAYNAAGQSVTTTRQVVINNVVTAPPPPSGGGTSGLTAQFTAPTSGGVLKGDASGIIQGPPNCTLTGTNIARAEFFLDNVLLNTDGNASNGFGCWLNTNHYQPGSHTLKAVAYNSAGQSVTVSQPVVIEATTTTPPPPPPPPPSGGTSAISSSDIVGRASADQLFSSQTGYNMQAYGDHISAPSIPESGKHGTVLPNGETLRFGKVFDPAGGPSKALQFQVYNTDPNTSGAKRAELRFMNTIQWDQTYWVAFSAYVYDWGISPNGDEALFGTQLHTGNDSLNLSPSFSLYTLGTGDRQFKVSARWSTSCSSSGCGTQSSVNSPNMDIPFGRWVDFVFKFRQNTTGSGFLQVWMDGTQIFNHQGNLGFNVGVNDYMKFGYYNWTGAQGNARKVLIRAPHIVNDPTGGKYSAADMRGLLISAASGTGSTGGSGEGGVCADILCAAQ